MRTLFYNGDILTMESPHPAEAVLTEGERILAVGDLSAISPLAGRGSRAVDLQGGALIPGMTDCTGGFWQAVLHRLPCESGGRTARAAVRQTWAEYRRMGYTAVCAHGVTSQAVKLLGGADLPATVLQMHPHLQIICDTDAAPEIPV